MDNFTRAYIDAALWSSTDDVHETPLSETYGVLDFDAATLAQMERDCARFQEQAGARLGERPASGGHDFWLTRNHHGAGFWGGDWPVHGDALTALAHSFGEFSLYVHDGKIYGEG